MMGVRRLMRAAAVFAAGMLLALGFAPTGLAQTFATPPTLFNNYFVTGDYAVGGVGLRGLGDATGYATGTIAIPDPNYSNSTGVPAGADIVGAFLYWQTVESSQTTFAGQQGYFRALVAGTPSTGYPITGFSLGNPNAPVSWSSGGCAGASNGSKTIRTYRADVRGYLPADPSTGMIPSRYEVRLADSGSNGSGAPLTSGATLVIIYRVLPAVAVRPLNAIVIYDGSYAPSNTSQTTSLAMQGFYQTTASPSAKLTQIVGNGQSNKYEQVIFNGAPLNSLNTAAFPGIYNGSWDNPTWDVSPYFTGFANPPGMVQPQVTTQVAPSSSNAGCVSWGAVILSTTVQDSDNDGLLDVWEKNQGYCDALDTSGSCDSTHSSWVDLSGADANKQDAFLQVDYMCNGTLNADGTCNTGTTGHSHLPSAAAQNALKSAFSAHSINVHITVKNAILEQTCTDNLTATPAQYCPYPGTAGTVGWKYGFEYIKYTALNPTDTTCQTTGVCQRNFQYGQKDSYHYALFGHGLGIPDWSFQNGTLTSVSVSGNVATFTTSTPIATSFDRVTIGSALSNPNLNGVFLTTSSPVVGSNTFSVTLPTSVTGTVAYTKSTDPNLMVASDHLRSGSGFSDIGGADSLITLGQWGADGTTTATVSGTFMHELGHSLTLTHGGIYPASATAAVPLTYEPNCKSNYQSVMNYLFQVDLVGPDGVLDYSSQQLGALNEPSLTSPFSIGGSAMYSTTAWYDAAPPNGVGSAATRHCDGTPIVSNDVYSGSMYRIQGSTSGITSSFPAAEYDINFDGKQSALHGFNDWTSLDLRQIGASGSDFAGAGFYLGGGGIAFTGGGIAFTGGGIAFTGGGIAFTGGGIAFTSGGIAFTGGGTGEIDFDTANSTVRPPRKLTSGVTSTLPRSILLNWTAPGFGQIASYNIYKGVNAAPGTSPSYSVLGSPLATSYTDTAVVCGPLYYYFVTAVIQDASGTRESAPSNTVTQKACGSPYIFTGFYSPLSAATAPDPSGQDTSYSGAFNIGKSVTAKWTLQDSSGNSAGNLNANALYAVAVPAGVPCWPNQVSPVYNTPSASVATLYSPSSGAKGNSTFRISSSNNQFIFNWDTTGFAAGCYVLELDLDSGQVERTALKLR
jgi:hypothetical protein